MRLKNCILMLEISFIIVNWNTKDFLLQCIASIYETVKGISFEIWVVDNGSSDGSVGAVKEKYPGIRVIENQINLGFAAANNLALARMGGRYALLLNTDAALTEGAVSELHDFMQGNPEAAIACGQLLNPDGSKQNSIANFPSLLSLLSNETLLRVLFPRRFPSKRRRYRTPLEIESGIGACMIVRKQAMDQVGLLDDRYFFFLEETDWAYRMRNAGWKIYFVPTARISHAQGKSVETRADAKIMFYRSRYIFFRKWYSGNYPVICVAVFSRLLINTFLSLIGLALTLGLKKDLNRKLIVYSKLLAWHLRGCP
ncbi:MAG: glycosyltransferase family 2 protein [Pseudomonadota bacterium]